MAADTLTGEGAAGAVERWTTCRCGRMARIGAACACGNLNLGVAPLPTSARMRDDPATFFAGDLAKLMTPTPADPEVLARLDLIATRIGVLNDGIAALYERVDEIARLVRVGASR